MSKSKTAYLLSVDDLKNPLGLSKEYRIAVIHEFHPLGEIDPDLTRRVVRYIIDGTDETVLLAAGGCAKAGTELALAGITNWHAHAKVTAARQQRAKVICPTFSVVGKSGTPPKPQPEPTKPAAAQADEKLNPLELARRQGAAKVQAVPPHDPSFEVPPAVLQRLGEVFEALGRVDRGPQFQPVPGWPAWLCFLVAEWLNADQSGASNGHLPARSISFWDSLCRATGVPSDLLVRVVADRESHQRLVSLRTYYAYSATINTFFDGWGPFAAQYPAVLIELLARPGAEDRLHTLMVLTQNNVAPIELVDTLVNVACDTAKQPREAALPLLRQQPEAARSALEAKLQAGETAVRHEAVQCLWRLFGEAVAERLQAHAETEKSERIQQTISKFLAVSAPTAEESTAEPLAIPPRLPIEIGHVPLPPGGREALREYFASRHRDALKQHAAQIEQWNGPNRPNWMRHPGKPPEPPDAKVVQMVIDFVEGARADLPVRGDASARNYLWGGPAWQDWMQPPACQLIHLVRMAYVFELAWNTNGWWNMTALVDAYRERSPEPKFGLRELEQAYQSLPEFSKYSLGWMWLSIKSKWNNFCEWEPAAIWPLFAEKEEILREVLKPGDKPSSVGENYGYYWRENARKNSFRVLSMFPKLPPAFTSMMWDLALGEAKGDRLPAQEVLATSARKTEKIAVALGDGRQGVRQAAAEWLGRLGDPAAVEPLKQAFRKEKQESVKGAIMGAFENLKADVNEFLDRKKLADEAVKGLAKKRPKGLDWFPLESLPALHWADNGEAVVPEIVQWWVVQGVQQKLVGASPLLSQYLKLCRPAEAERLAQHVLRTWIAYDTTTANAEQCAARAKTDADRQWSLYGTQQYYIDYYKSKENLYSQLLAQYSGELINSAIGEKGMLSIVASAGDQTCVKLCEQYLRKWFGHRLAQCKCLLEVLAWIKHPLAIQVLLSIANRFRTKALRQAAEGYVTAIAEREGWTLDELADRTLPDAGFAREVDDEGRPIGHEAELVLDYGPRKFHVTLNDDLEPVITNEEGKKVKSPPAPGKSDDAELATAAKKAFSDAKKTVKEVVKRQGERFYESLCTARRWRFDEWKRYLADHPIVGRLCTRLVWIAHGPGEEGPLLGGFRPLEDGSLTNERDETVTLPDDAQVALAHTCNVPGEVAQAWQQHLVDYDVEPLLIQFGRATYTLPAGKEKETDITDFVGHMLTTFKLRGKATKLGYVRGDAEDGGAFYLYRKPFGSLGLQAVLEFTGSYLPEQEIAAALKELYFTAIKRNDEGVSSWGSTKMALGKVPPVLLSECYNDAKQIAADGSGFDKDWEKKSFM